MNTLKSFIEFMTISVALSLVIIFVVLACVLTGFALLIISPFIILCAMLDGAFSDNAGSDKEK